MDCKNIQSNLTAFDDQELSGSLLQEVSSHLQGCSGCQTLHHRLTATGIALESLPVQEPDDYAAVRFLSRLKSRKRVMPVYRWAFAASLLILIGAGAFFNNRFHSEQVSVDQTTLNTPFFPMVDDRRTSNNNLFEAVFVDYPAQEGSQ